MPHVQLPSIRLYYEEHGAGVPILGIHGTSDSVMLWHWDGAVAALSRLGRLIVYDRRGCTRSERPEGYVDTSLEEHADDAAALLLAVSATPAIVIGDSYGASIAAMLAIRHPQQVRALVLLEPALLGLTPEGRRLGKRLQEATAAAAARDVGLVSEVFLRMVLGDETWDEYPEPLKAIARDNGSAVLAEARSLSRGPDAAALATVTCPTLLVQSEHSPEGFRSVAAVIEAAVPSARRVRVTGGHLISPAEPVVLQFVQQELVAAQTGAQV